jgi:hypothetical protein
MLRTGQTGRGRQGAGPGPLGEPRQGSRKQLMLASPHRPSFATQPDRDEVVRELTRTWLTAGGIDIREELEAGDEEAASPSPVKKEHVDMLVENFNELTRDMATLMVRVSAAKAAALAVVRIATTKFKKSFAIGNIIKQNRLYQIGTLNIELVF